MTFYVVVNGERIAWNPSHEVAPAIGDRVLVGECGVGWVRVRDRHIRPNGVDLICDEDGRPS